MREKMSPGQHAIILLKPWVLTDSTECAATEQPIGSSLRYAAAMRSMSASWNVVKRADQLNDLTSVPVALYRSHA